MRQMIKALNDLEENEMKRGQHLVIDGREKIGLNSVDWIHLTPDRNQWRVLVNMLLTLRV
jgi:hypothetical protein